MKQEDTQPYWVGRLSAAIAFYLRDGDRSDLKEALDDFLRSPAPSDELKAILLPILAEARSQQKRRRRL